MVNIFNIVLQMSFDASVVILVVLVMRLILAKAPKKYSYMLWSVVAFRLCCPISFAAFFSVFRLGQPNAPELPNSSGDIIIENTFGNPNVGENVSVSTVGGAELTSTNWIQIFNTTVMIIWFIGFAAVLTYAIVSYSKVKRMMSNACRYDKNVFMSERVSSPFALGFIRPKIYIPFGLDDETREQILMHERCHIKRGDHIIKPLAFLILAVHWFNPFCWLAFKLMSLDMEMSCDERVLKLRGDEVMKKNYSKALLSFATNRRFPAPSPIAFSESGGNAEKRIKHALYWKKPKFIVNLICIILCVAVLAACAANAEVPSWDKVKTETFGENPYNFVFASNGDGTCVIREIRVDIHYEGDIHLIIPEKAPNGDVVIGIDNFWGLDGDSVMRNLPRYLTKSDMEAIVTRIEKQSPQKAVENLYSIGYNPARDAKTFFAFFSEEEAANSNIYYKLEPYLQRDEKMRLSTILDVYGFDEEDAYQYTVNFLDSLEKDSHEQNEAAREAFKHLYFDGRRITEITFPESVKSIEYGSFDGCDSLEKVNGLSNDCAISLFIYDETSDTGYINEHVIISTADKEDLTSTAYEKDSNEDLINAIK